MNKLLGLFYLIVAGLTGYILITDIMNNYQGWRLGVNLITTPLNFIMGFLFLVKD